MARKVIYNVLAVGARGLRILVSWRRATAPCDNTESYLVLEYTLCKVNSFAVWYVVRRSTSYNNYQVLSILSHS